MKRTEGRESAESEMSPSFNLQAHRDPQPTVRSCLSAPVVLQRPEEDIYRKCKDLAQVGGGGRGKPRSRTNFRLWSF